MRCSTRNCTSCGAQNHHTAVQQGSSPNRTEHAACRSNLHQRPLVTCRGHASRHKEHFKPALLQHTLPADKHLHVLSRRLNHSYATPVHTTPVPSFPVVTNLSTLANAFLPPTSPLPTAVCTPGHGWQLPKPSNASDDTSTRRLPACKLCAEGYASGPEVADSLSGTMLWVARRAARHGAICISCAPKKSSEDRTKCID